ncbi:MAG: GntR family transcriptional regulator [Sulfobacillus sp.]
MEPERGMPLYLQLKRLIKAQIQDGRLAPGDRVPSERELSDQFGMSRMTARQALIELVREGLLYREQGRGTFVAVRKVSQGLLTVTSFTEDMHSRGIVPSSVILSLTTEAPSLPDRERLRLDLGHQMVRVRRLRLGDGRPMALEEASLPQSLVEGIEEHDLSRGSLYEFLKSRQIELQGAHQTLEAILADEEQAMLLAVPQGAPLLLLERLSYDQFERPAEFVRAVYRGDRYRFYVELGH